MATLLAWIGVFVLAGRLGFASELPFPSASIGDISLLDGTVRLGPTPGLAAIVTDGLPPEALGPVLWGVDFISFFGGAPQATMAVNRQVVLVGDPVEFNVNVGGGVGFPSSYQWRKNGTRQYFR